MSIHAAFQTTVARNREGRVTPKNGQRHCVLVVEDDAGLLQLLIELLGKAGFETRFARNRAEVTAELNHMPLPDIVLMDVGLPDANGFHVLERIRSHESLSTLPVIMMTGKSQANHVARGLALGADGYVTKPFKLSGLVNAVNTVLGVS
jgi:DNA-binding response OmpR family regulator